MSLNNVLRLAHLTKYRSRTGVFVNDIVLGTHDMIRFITWYINKYEQQSAAERYREAKKCLIVHVL